VRELQCLHLLPNRVLMTRTAGPGEVRSLCGPGWAAWELVGCLMRPSAS
jgi:hypothetical protein